MLPGPADPPDRPTARILLIGPGDRVLLFRWANPGGPVVWFTPGGGVDAGETFEQAAARELREEVGQPGLEIGPCVWTRSHDLAVGGSMFRLRERYFVVRTERAAVDSSGFTDVERSAIVGHCWMTPGEIAALHEMVSPSRLAELLPPILAGRYPDPPIDVGA